MNKKVYEKILKQIKTCTAEQSVSLINFEIYSRIDECEDHAAMVKSLNKTKMMLFDYVAKNKKRNLPSYDIKKAIAKLMRCGKGAVLNVNYLAKKTGLTPNSVNPKLMTDSPNLKTITKISEAFEMSVVEFMKYAEEKKDEK